MRNFGASDRMTTIMERFGLEDGQELEHPLLNRSVENAQKRVEQRNYMSRKHTLEYDDVMNKQREVVYGYRNETLDTDNPRQLVEEVIDEAIPLKVGEYLKADGDEPNHRGLLQWANMTFPIGLSPEKAGLESRTVEENSQFLVETVRKAYLAKCGHEDPDAVKGLERIIVLNAIDKLWQEHLFGMDALREGIQLQRIGQKDPLVEYKNEAYSMFVELMANIKYEVLHNLFRSTSNLQAFEKFLASLPQTLLHETLSGQGQPSRRPQHQPSPLNPIADALSPRPAPASSQPVVEQEPPRLEIPSQRRELPKVGRNDPCPCGSGKKFKNCCEKTP